MPTILLSFVVTLLAFAVGALFRQVAMLGIRLGIDGRWPLNSVAAGQIISFPDTAPGYTGFMLLLSDDHDEYGPLMSLARVAARWDRELTLCLADAGKSTPWIDYALKAHADVKLVRAAPAFVRQLAPIRLPAALYLDGGRVIDASVELSSPSIIGERFQHAAGPLPSINTLEWSATWQ